MSGPDERGKFIEAALKTLAERAKWIEENWDWYSLGFEPKERQGESKKHSDTHRPDE